MIVVAAHAVPVRWRPARARRDAHAMVATRTPVEVPVIDAFPGEPTSVAFDVGEATTRGFAFEGRAWRIATRGDLDPGLSEAGRAATPDDLARSLSGEVVGHGAALPPGTPLRLQARHAPAGATRGRDVPPRIRDRVDVAVAESARAALRAYVARTFRVHRLCVLVAIPSPAILPGLGRRSLVARAPHAIGTDGHGIAFEAGRVARLGDFMRRVGGNRGFHDPRVALLLDMPAEVHGDGTDLRAFANDGTVLAAGIVDDALAAEDVPPSARDGLAAHAARLAPLATAGLACAVPEASFPDAALAILPALDAVRAAIPARRHPRPLNWLLHYAREVAVPALSAGVIPDEDLGHLACLGPTGPWGAGA